MCVCVIRPSTGVPKSSICGLVQAADALHWRCGWQTFSCKIGETEDGPFGPEGPANFVDNVGIVFRHQGSAPNSRCGFFFGNRSRLAIPTLPPGISHRNCHHHLRPSFLLLLLASFHLACILASRVKMEKTSRSVAHSIVTLHGSRGAQARPIKGRGYPPLPYP